MKNFKHLNEYISSPALLLIICIVVLFSTFIIQNNVSGNWVLILQIVQIITSMILASFIWDIFGSRKQVELIQRLFQNQNSVDKSGLTNYWTNFRSIDWEVELKEAQTFHFCVIYARTFLSTNSELLEKLTRKGCKISACLPDYNDSKLIATLSEEINMKEEEDLIRMIRESIETLERFNAKIYLYSQPLKFTFYVINEKTVILAMSKHRKEKIIVPSFKFSENVYIDKPFLSFVLEESDYIISKSKEL